MTERVKVATLGCEKNLVDSEIMSSLIHGRGYSLTDNAEDAMVSIVNTCGFIDGAKEESVNTILPDQVPDDVKEFWTREIDGEVFVRGQDLAIGHLATARVIHSFDFDLSGGAFS